jgi:pentatricopeptide repeat protein
LYVTCNSLVDAHLLFDEISNRNIFCWNAILRGYTKNGMFEETLRLYHQILKDGIKPDHFTFPYVLKACGDMLALEDGLEVHDLVVSCGIESEILVGSALIDMFAKCGSIGDTRQMFDKISQRDLVSWNTIIFGYTQTRQREVGFETLCEKSNRKVWNPTQLPFLVFSPLVHIMLLFNLAIKFIDLLSKVVSPCLWENTI